MREQNGYAQTFDGGINFMVADPQGEFSDNVDNVGLGANLYFTIRVNQSPLVAGVEIGFVNYGRESRIEPFSTTIPDVTVEVVNSNNIALFHLTLGVQPATGVFQPYIGGLIGFNYLFTETEIKDEDDVNEIASSTNLDDFAFSFGANAGLKIKFAEVENKNADSNRTFKFYLDLKTRFLFGAEAEYLKEGSIRRTNGNVRFDVKQSQTNLVTYHIGLGISF